MIESTFALCFALCALAVWRVAHLLAKENGPWDLLVRLRARLGSGMLGHLMDCFYCLSFWISLPAAICISSSRMGFVIQWLALSAAACLVERAAERLRTNLHATLISTEYLEKVIRGA